LGYLEQKKNMNMPHDFPSLLPDVNSYIVSDHREKVEPDESIKKREVIDSIDCAKESKTEHKDKS
jgi:hypothetical protein